MKKIEAKIIADSLSPQGNRIISYLLTYPRFIHSELMNKAWIIGFIFVTLLYEKM